MGEVCPRCHGAGFVDKLGFMLGMNWVVPSELCTKCKGKGVIKK